MSSEPVAAPDPHPYRGEIYWVDWSPGRGSEQLGRRPGLVISPTTRNKYMKTCVVAALTTKIRDEVRQGRSPVSVFLPKDQPLEKESAVLGFQVMTISNERLDEYAGKLTTEQMVAVDVVVRKSFGL